MYTEIKKLINNPIDNTGIVLYNVVISYNPYIFSNSCEVMIMTEKSSPAAIPGNIYELLSKYLNSIKFGSVTLVIQNGKIVQIECSEKIRTEKL